MLEWNVYISNFNRRVIEEYNIFKHAAFVDDCKKTIKKYNKAARAGEFDMDAFSEDIRRHLLYYFWSKCEWEVIIDHWPGGEHFKPEKIDVYDQVRLNWDKFIIYLWEHRKEL